MIKDSITKRKTHRERIKSKTSETVRLWKLTLKCQDVMKYNFAK